MWFKILFYLVLVICALHVGLLIYLAIEYPIVLIAIIVATVLYMRYLLTNAVVMPPDVEI